MLLRSNGLVGNNSEALKVVWHDKYLFLSNNMYLFRQKLRFCSIKLSVIVNHEILE